MSTVDQTSVLRGIAERLTPEERGAVAHEFGNALAPARIDVETALERARARADDLSVEVLEEAVESLERVLSRVRMLTGWTGI